MANAIPNNPQRDCMILLEGDGWTRGKCQWDRNSNAYMVMLEPIPPGLRQRFVAEGNAPEYHFWYNRAVIAHVDANDPKFRLILSDEVTYA